MKISAVFCLYFSERKDAFLKTLDILNRKTDDIEIVVVVDGNRELYDELLIHLEKVSIPYQIILNEHNLGLSASRNVGIKHTTGEIVAFIDDDAIPGPKWVTELTKTFDDRNVLAVGGKAIPIGIKNLSKHIPPEFYWLIGCTYAGHPAKKTEVRNVIGCNMAFRREAFEQTGYFREDLGRKGCKLVSGEETEFSMRLKVMNIDKMIVYNPRMIVYHIVPVARVNRRYFIERAFYGGKSIAILNQILKNYQLPRNTVEMGYLKTLLLKSYPSWLKKVLLSNHKQENINSIFLTTILIFSTMLGYAVSKKF